MQRVVERLQVRIHFFPRVAGQKAETLSRFNGRPRQHDPVDFPVAEGRDGHGDGQVGLPRTCRADGEDDIALADLVHVLLLIGTPCPDPFPPGKHVDGFTVTRSLVFVAFRPGSRCPDDVVHFLRPALLDGFYHFAQHAGDLPDLFRLARDDDLFAPGGDFGVEFAFDGTQPGVKLAVEREGIDALGRQTLRNRVFQ